MKSIGTDYVFEDNENTLIRVKRKVVIKNKYLIPFIPILESQKIIVNDYNERRMKLTLPASWDVIYDKSRKMYIFVDNKSRVRITVRNDNIYVYVRYTYNIEPNIVNGKYHVKGIVLDYFKPVHDIPISQDTMNNIIIDTRGNEDAIRERVDSLCEKFMNSQYPDWNKPWSYWD